MLIRLLAVGAIVFVCATRSLVADEGDAAPADASAPPQAAASSPVWLDSYSEAMKQAKADKKLMLIHFYRPSDQRRQEAPDAADSVVNIEKQFNRPSIRESLDRFVLIKLPLDSSITTGGKSQRVLSHQAFTEMRGGPGIAVIDFAHEDQEYYGYVVSVLPFTPGGYYRFHPSHIEALVDLPPGTLTQRSMVLAVRIHPEHPASTSGEEDPILLSEAAGHSNYQAQTHSLGHQGWGSRFERIIGKLLGRGKSSAPVEVVAESWPGEGLMDSCVDCVASWRQSSGHWSQVRAQQASYGYDIRQGDDGIWYATGIFSGGR